MATSFPDRTVGNSQQTAVLDPPSGEHPLTIAPQWGGRGGGQQAAQVYAFNDFKQQFGRNPTQSELNLLSSSYIGGDPNIANLASGKSAIAAYYQSLANSPTKIAANQQQQALDAYNKNSAQFDGQTNQIFQQTVGRNATSDEATHFGALLASGQIDGYGMTQLLGQSQEAQQRQTQQYQTQLQQNLQETQADYYNKYIVPGIQSQFASQGRDVNSSGFQNAAIQAAKQQNYDLQNYLAQFGAGQYGQSAANQQAVYQQYLGNLYGRQNANITNQLQQQNWLQQRNAQLADYQMQQQAYNNYLQNYGKRSSGIGGLIGGAIGGGLGAVYGNPLAGYQIGSGLGQGIQGAVQGNRGYATI